MRRLRDESGETILMALLFLLLAAILSAIMLTAATSAARHQQNDRLAQQNYLTVSSAAELMRDSILADSFTYTLTKREFPDENGDIQSQQTKTCQYHEGLLAPWLNGAIDTVSGAEPVIRGCADTIEVQVPMEGDKPNKPIFAAVQAKLTVFAADAEATPKLRIELSLLRQGADSEDCRMNLEVRGRLVTETRTLTDDGENAYTTITTTRLEWNSAEITKGGAANG